MKGPPLPPLGHQTINAALRFAAGSRSGLTFVDAQEEERTLSWLEVYARAEAVAESLRERGVELGDRVALVLPTGESFMDAFFGTLLAGAVPVPLYPPVRLGRLGEYHASTARMISLVRAALVLTDARVGKLLGEAVRRSRPRLGWAKVESLLGPARGATALEVSPDALALIQFSSGSTVDPKPVALSHRNLLAQLASLKTLFPAPRVRRHLGVSWLPLYHDMGLIGTLLSAVYYPGPLVLIPPELFLARPALWLRAISRHQATISAAPNFAYALCVKRVRDEELQGVDLSSWQLALNGAEPVSPETLRRFAERFAPFGLREDALLPVYGLSEAALAVTFSPPEQRFRRAAVDPEALARDGTVREGAREIASVGTPVPGCEVQVRGEDGAVRPERRVGRIHVRAPFLMRGYFEQEEATQRAIVDGWLDTGDLGFLLDGALHVCGRAKDLVIIRGANHAPQEFEDALLGVEGVRPGCAAACGFVPPGEDSEALLLLVERAQASDPARDAELETAVQAAVLAHTRMRPHTVRVLAPGTLPRTSSGKLRRAEALRRFLAGTLTAPQKVNALLIAKELTRSAVGYLRVGRPVHPEGRREAAESKGQDAPDAPVVTVPASPSGDSGPSDPSTPLRYAQGERRPDPEQCGPDARGRDGL